MSHLIPSADASAPIKAAPQAAPRYLATASISPQGVARSVETTLFLWSDQAPVSASVEAKPPERAVILSAALERATWAYVERVQAMTLGLIGPRGEGSAPSLYLRPLGLLLMEFGEPRQGPSGELTMPVCRGLLCSRHASPERQGELVFRWWREDACEVFQTEVRDYTPIWVGKRAWWIQRAFYMATQMVLHRVVMWRYHVWLRRARQELLAQG